MNYQPYAECQKGRADWIPVLPVHWEHLLGRRVFGNRRDKPLPDDPQLAATQKYGVLPQAEFMEREGQKVALALKGVDGFRHVQKGDFVISLRSFEGGIEFSPYSGCVSPAYTVLSPKRKIESSFFRYLLKSAPYIAALQSTTDSLRDGKSITYDQFAAIPLPIPSVSEQSTIANFLDRETAKIDTLIDKQEKLIKLLEEKRQAVISHAVTKGLDPDVRMKDSGVEWLGEVPEHWNVRRLKFLCRVQTGGRDTVDAKDDGEYPFFVRSQTVERIDSYSADCEAVLTAGDGAGVGKVFHYFTGQFDFHQRVYMLNRFKSVKGEFLFNFLRENFFKVALEGNAKSTVDSLRMPIFLNFPLTVPPEEEQVAILAHVRKSSEHFAQLAQSANKAVELLRERRTALISAAVTGKIDVRNAV
jgi:type I restriction enzyme S subunit